MGNSLGKSLQDANLSGSKTYTAEQLQKVLSRIVSEAVNKLVEFNADDVRKAIEADSILLQQGEKADFTSLSRHNIPDHYKNIEVNEANFRDAAKIFTA